MGKKICLLAFSIISFASLQGCGTILGAKNVHFYDNLANKPPDNAISIYLDAKGNLYPNDAPITYRTPKKHGYNLEYELLKQPNFCKEVNDTIFSEKSESRSLCETNSWKDSQSEMWRSIASNIYNHSVAGGKSKTIVILIHGFNVPSARKDYRIARANIEKNKLDSESLLFVEVNWNGWQSTYGPGVWGKAQYAGPLVGFQLRQLFSAIDTEYTNRGMVLPKVRILTHSSGAFVVGATLGDPISALPMLYKKNKAETACEKNSDDCHYKEFKDHRRDKDGKYAIPNFPDIRVGIFAAATPPDTFVGSDKFLGGLQARNTVLIISSNPNDEVLNKMGIGSNFPLLGATTLGTKPDIYCNILLPRIKDPGPKEFEDFEAHAFDFDRNDAFWPKEYRKKHDFDLYLKQGDATQQGGAVPFLRFLMQADDASKRAVITCPPTQKF